MASSRLSQRRLSLALVSISAVQVTSRQPQVAPQAASMPKSAPANNDVIDKASFFRNDSESEPKTKSVWICPNLRPVPAFYPLEKSSRLVDDETDNVTGRLSECLRVLSVQAVFNNETVSIGKMVG